MHEMALIDLLTYYQSSSYNFVTLKKIMNCLVSQNRQKCLRTGNSIKGKVKVLEKFV